MTSYRVYRFGEHVGTVRGETRAAALAKSKASHFGAIAMTTYSVRFTFTTSGQEAITFQSFETWEQAERAASRISRSGKYSGLPVREIAIVERDSDGSRTYDLQGNVIERE